MHATVLHHKRTAQEGFHILDILGLADLLPHGDCEGWVDAGFGTNADAEEMVGWQQLAQSTGVHYSRSSAPHCLSYSQRTSVGTSQP